MMEPGEAPALGALVTSALADTSANPLDIGAFVRWLLAHEVFVAVPKTGGEPVGFAAARDALDLYWLSALLVDEAHRRQGIGSALLAAVVARAGWFFHRAIGHPTLPGAPTGELHYAKRGFVTVSRDSMPDALLHRLEAETPAFASMKERVVAVRWL